MIAGHAQPSPLERRARRVADGPTMLDDLGARRGCLEANGAFEAGPYFDAERSLGAFALSTCGRTSCCREVVMPVGAAVIKVVSVVRSVRRLTHDGRWLSTV